MTSCLMLISKARFIRPPPSTETIEVSLNISIRFTSIGIPFYQCPCEHRIHQSPCLLDHQHVKKAYFVTVRAKGNSLHLTGSTQFLRNMVPKQDTKRRNRRIFEEQACLRQSFGSFEISCSIVLRLDEPTYQSAASHRGNFFNLYEVNDNRFVLFDTF